jgi:hypothetical protein
LLVAFLTACAGAALALPVSDWAMELLDVSNFEGRLAYGAVCLWTPLGFLAGAVVGFVTGLTMGGRGFGGYLKRQVVSLVIVSALIAASAGLAYLAADHAPVIDGKTLSLQIEMRVPKGDFTPAELREKRGFCVYLFVPEAHRQNTGTIDWAGAAQDAQFITLPVWAPINSRHGARSITADMEGEEGQLLDVKLPGSPQKIDDAWTDWLPMGRADRMSGAPERQNVVRYRVRFESEYSPAPLPESQEEPSTAPEESATPQPATTP